jgi:virginiamycin B lyase
MTMETRAPMLVVAALLTAAAAVHVRSQEGAPGRQGRPVTLPEGPGRELVQSACVQCHTLDLITNTGHTREAWKTVMGTMVALPKEQAELLADYLARHFPDKPRPAAVLVPGSETVNIKEWDLPTLGSRPHDPLGAADGSLWWTGQRANVLGRLDPKTGAMKEFPLKTPHSGPHGLTEDGDGNIWYTGNATGHIGKLDPGTGEVTEYPMPYPPRAIPTPRFSTRAAPSGSRCSRATSWGASSRGPGRSSS